MTPASDKVNTKVIFALFLVHFTGDLYASFVSPLLPIFAETYSLSLAQVGLLAGMSRLLAFVVQPSVGYLADRYQTRFFLLGGAIMAVIFIPLGGWAWGFGSLLIFLGLGSIGQAMFHPPAAGMVSLHSGNKAATAMSLFGLGGTLAFGVGPLAVTSWVTWQGLNALPYLMIPGLVLCLALWIVVPVPETEGLKNLGFFGAVKEALGDVWKAIIVIWLVVLLRSFVSQSFMAFFPIHWSAQGNSLVSVGAVISTYVVAGAVSGVLAGHLADKIGTKPIFLFSYISATPCLLLVLYMPGDWVYGGAALAGFTLLASLPLAVTMAQALAPKGRSMVSSLVMGFAFGAGGMLTPLTGHLADLYGIREVLFGVGLIPLLSSPLILLLPGKKAAKAQ